MDDSSLIELTKCFSMLANKHDGTFLKIWSEGGTVKFHLSNNNVRKPSFQHSMFSQHSTSTPNRKFEEKVDDKLVLSDEKEVVNEQNKDQEHEEQPRNEEDEEEEDLREEEQPEQESEDGQQERVKLQVNSESVQSSASDRSLENVNCAGYPPDGTFQRKIFSYCEGALETISRDRSTKNLSCCSLCKLIANNRLKYVCKKHTGSAWHEEIYHNCERFEPVYR